LNEVQPEIVRLVVKDIVKS